MDSITSIFAIFKPLDAPISIIILILILRYFYKMFSDRDTLVISFKQVIERNTEAYNSFTTEIAKNREVNQMFNDFIRNELIHRLNKIENKLNIVEGNTALIVSRLSLNTRLELVEEKINEIDNKEI